MPAIREIDLRGRIGGNAAIKFLRAEVSKEHRLPFALIRYSLYGKEQDLGLRLDLDKRVFIDHLPDEENEGILERAAPKIVEILGAEL